MEEDNLLKLSKDELKKTKDEIILHKDVALQKINNLLIKYINNPGKIDKADKLSYWLEDYCRLLEFEDEFRPDFLKTYSRGDVIKVNLGYNIGNEEGGLHYCIVVDKHNSMSSGIITIIPLTSDKGKKPHFSEVNIGNEIYSSFQKKYNSIMLDLSHKVNNLNVDTASHQEISSALEQLHFIKKLDAEMSKMKKGSIALVSQITTISKQKIYDPQKTGDILSGIKISNKSLDLINNKIKQLFVKI